MIKTEKFDLDTHFITIYRNFNEKIIRSVITDLNGIVLQDELCEYDTSGNKICDCVYDNSQTLVAYREYYSEQDYFGYRDYKLINGKFELLLSTKQEWLIADKKHKFTWYDNQGQFICYDLFEYDDDIGDMIWQFCYDKDDNMVKPKYLEQYCDYYLKFI
ncbi:hypothetical protein [Moraxella bovis]|uniref:Uncharacterized protein n=2 Tax=Moraxella bovis TaxID=476 RepID=A0A378PYK8_MORBO|nr:hypothetical protein [Moraxella bovis]STY93274.1 Uncharacterised protein [Moraxella bovis]